MNLKMRFLPKSGVTLVVGVFVLSSLMSGVGCDKQVAQPTSDDAVPSNPPRSSSPLGTELAQAPTPNTPTPNTLPQNTPSAPATQPPPSGSLGPPVDTQPTVTAPPSDEAKPPVEQSTFVPSGNVGFEIGDIAPDIEGPDLDGSSFKLSDYRGKVVVLDFWGDW